MTRKEWLLPEPDPDNWLRLDRAGGMLTNRLWVDPGTGASIALLRVPKGAGIRQRHRHASNQFMYCLEGEYKYLNPEPGLVLRPGSLYMNPKGEYHGPTVALTDCVLLEIYDGAHYFETPAHHTDETVGRVDPNA